MFNLSIFLFASVLFLLNFATPISSCAPVIELKDTTGHVIARSQRSIKATKFEFPVTLNVQTFYKYSNSSNERNENAIEKNITTFFDKQQQFLLKSYFADHEIMFKSNMGDLHISFTFFQGPADCFELKEWYGKAFQEMQEIKQVTIVCKNEFILIKQ